MEKFSSFNDPFTGVNPFTIPPPPPSIARAARTLLLALLQAPLLAALALLWWLSHALSSAAAAACGGSMRSLHAAGLERLCARLALLILGLPALREAAVPRQAVRSRVSQRAPRLAVSGGDLILANRCSPLDVLVLAAAYGPLFTVQTQDGGLTVVSAATAFARACSGSPKRLSAGDSEVDAQALVASSRATWLRRPIVVFPEVRWWAGAVLGTSRRRP